METAFGQASSRVVVGIDVGATYTAIAFSSMGFLRTGGFAGGNDRVKFVTGWPIHNENLDRVARTVVKSAVFVFESWGENIPAQISMRIEPTRFFKLRLLSQHHMPRELLECLSDTDSAQMANDNGENGEYATAVFLRGIWGFARLQIGEYLNIPKNQNAGFHFVVTLPPAWTNEAREAMKRAVRHGLQLHNYPGCTLSLATESDAAALSIMFQLKHLPQNLKEGDAFTIVDAGGATVDIVTYRVKNTAHVAFEQCAAPETVMAGFILVETAFTKKLQQMVKQAFPLEPPLAPQEIDDIIDKHLKEKCCLRVKLPGRFVCSTSPCVIFTPDEMHQVFRDGGLDKITQAVAEQVMKVNNTPRCDTTVKHIVPVGGYGANPYLRDWLRKTSAPAQVQDLDSERWHVNSLSVISRLATCHGAVLHGLNDLARHEGSPLAINASVLQLSSPVNVGVCNSSGRVVWLIKKGQGHGFSDARTTRLSVQLKPGGRVVSVSIVSFAGEQAPLEASPTLGIVANLVVPVHGVNQNDLLRVTTGVNPPCLILPLDITIAVQPADLIAISVHFKGQLLLPLQYRAI